MNSKSVVTVLDLESYRDPAGHFLHRIPHLFDGWVMVQVWGSYGQVIGEVGGSFVPLPGAAHTVYQDGKNSVYLPVLNQDYYPITVVMIG